MQAFCSGVQFIFQQFTDRLAPHLQPVELRQAEILVRSGQPVEQRLCRWLLTANDRIQSNELLLTRDILAAMIGSRRPAVSLISGTLQAAGLIQATRGKITVLNREEMEEASCECYAVIKQAFDRYLQS